MKKDIQQKEVPVFFCSSNRYLQSKIRRSTIIISACEFFFRKYRTS